MAGLTQSPAREQLVDILGSLVPPPNFKVVLDVDQMTENLILRVLKRAPQNYKVFGKVFWSVRPNWTNMECEQRRIVARTYESLVEQLSDRPEFLEFEISVEGLVRYETAWEY